jgi:hypothetical protein
MHTQSDTGSRVGAALASVAFGAWAKRLEAVRRVRRICDEESFIRFSCNSSNDSCNEILRIMFSLLCDIGIPPVFEIELLLFLQWAVPHIDFLHSF